MTKTPGGRCALDYRACRPVLYRHDRRATDYLDIGKKLFS